MNINTIIEKSEIKNLKDVVDFYRTGKTNNELILKSCVSFNTQGLDCSLTSNDISGYEIHLYNEKIGNISHYIVIDERRILISECGYKEKKKTSYERIFDIKPIDVELCTEEWYFQLCLDKNIHNISLENIKYLMEISSIYQKIEKKY